MAKDASLLVRIGANLDDLDKAIGQMGSRFDKMGANLRNVGTSLTKWVTAPMVAAGGISVKFAGDFEASMNRVSALGEITGADLDMLRKQALQLGADTQFSAKTAADAMGELSAAGLDANQVFAAMPGVLDLAAAGEMGVAQAAEIAVNIMGGFQLAAEESGRAADVLAKAAAAGTVGLGDLGYTFKYVGPIAQAAGVSFEEVAAATTLLSNAGIKGQAAGTGLRGMLASLIAPSTEGAAALANLGIQTMDASGKMLPLADIIQQLGDKGATTSDIFTIFGRETASAVQALVTMGAPAIREMTKELENSEGAASRMARTLNAGWKGAVEQLGGSVETLAISLGDLLMPAALKVVEALTAAANKVGEWIEKLKEAPVPVKALAAALAGVVVGIGPVVGGLGTLMGVASALKAGMVALGISMEAALIGSGIGVAVVALGAAALVVYQNWDKVREFFDSRFPGAIDKAKGVFDTLIGIAKGVMGGVVDAVSGALETMQSVIKTAGGVIKGDWEQIFTGLLEITKQWTDHHTAMVENYFRGARNQWVKYGKWMVEGLRGGFREGLNEWRKDLVSAVVNFFGGGFREGVNKARTGLLAAVKGVYGDVARGAFTTFEDLNQIGNVTGTTLEGLENRFKRVAGATSDVVKETDKLIASQDDLQASSEEITAAWDEYNEALRDAEIEHRVMRDDFAFLKSNISAAEGLMKSLIKLGVDPASEAFQRLEEDLRTTYALLIQMEAAARAVTIAIASLPTQQQRENAEDDKNKDKKTDYAPKLLSPEVVEDMEKLKKELSEFPSWGDRAANALEGLITKLGSQGLGGAIAKTFGLTGAWGLGINAGIEALKGMGLNIDEVIKKTKESFAQLAQAIGETFAKIGEGIVSGLRGAGRWVSGFFPGYNGNAPGDVPRGTESGMGRGTRPPDGDTPPRGTRDYENWVGQTQQSKIDAVFKGIEESFKEIEIEAQVMGDGFDQAAAEIRVMEQGLIDLLNVGVSPTNEQFIELSEKLEAARAEAAALARQMEIDSIFSGLAEDLASIEQQALVMGSGFDVAGAKVQVLQSRMIELLQAGIEPTSEEFLALASDLAVAREEAKAYADQMEVQNIWRNLGDSMADIDARAQVTTGSFNRFALEAQAIEQAMIELIKEGQQTTPQFDALARSLDETREQAKALEAQMAIKTFWEDLESDMARIEAQAFVMGDSFNAAEAKVRVIEQAMIDFIARGGNPASMAFKRLEAMLKANKDAAALFESALEGTADAAREAGAWVRDYNEAMRRQHGKPKEEEVPEPETPAVPEPIRDTIQNITNVANNFNTSRLESGMDRLVKAAEILTDVNARGFTTLGYIMKGGDVSFEAIKRLPDLLKAASFDVTKLNRVTIGEGVTQNIYVQLDSTEIARATFIGMPSVANVYGVS